MRLTDGEKATIVERYRNGESSIEIGRAIGRTHAAVLRHLKREGITRRPVGRHEQDHSTRRCTTCRKEQPLDDFPLSGRDKDHGHTHECKRCLRKRHHALRPDREAWAAQCRDRNRKRSYGLTPQDVQRIVDEQGGRCALCPAEVTVRSPLDHDHTTGKPRGVLCRRCNVCLHAVEAVDGWATRAEAYVRRHGRG